MMLIPLAATALLWFLIARANAVKRMMRLVFPTLPTKAAAILLVLAAMLAAAHGNLWAALCLFGASLWSLGRASRPDGGAGIVGRSALVETRLEGPRLRGRVLAGRHAGCDLDALDLAACLALLADCRGCDTAGAGLLEAYLHRRFPGWRPAADGDANARRGAARFANEMTEEEAHQVLGLGRGATRAEVVRSHRLAMKRRHPDRGGSAEEAARANEAKEVLLRRHH